MGGGSRRAGGLAVAIFAVAFLVAPADGWTQEPDAATQAKAHYELGMTAYGLGHYDRAVQAFLQAYEIDPAPILLHNVAQAYWKKGDHTPALMFYRRYLEADPRAKNRVQVRNRIRDLEALEKTLPPPGAQAGAGAVAPAPPPATANPPASPPPPSANAPAQVNAAPPDPAAHSPHAALGGDPTATPGSPANANASASANARDRGGAADAPDPAAHSPHAALGGDPTATPGSHADDRARGDAGDPANQPGQSPHAALGSSPTGAPTVADARAAPVRASGDRGPAEPSVADGQLARERGRVAIAGEPERAGTLRAPVSAAPPGVETPLDAPAAPASPPRPVVPPPLSPDLFTPAPPVSRSLPIYQRPWFWPTLGAVSLVTAAAIILLRPDDRGWTCGLACMSTREIP
jgi:hypothetical protein